MIEGGGASLFMSWQWKGMTSATFTAVASAERRAEQSRGSTLRGQRQGGGSMEKRHDGIMIPTDEGTSKTGKTRNAKLKGSEMR